MTTPRLSGFPISVVDIQSESLALLIGAVFTLTFLAAFAITCLMVFKRVFKRRPGPNGASSMWEFDLSGRLPVSKSSSDRIANVTAAALSRPELTPEKQERLDRMARTRLILVRVYRVVMIAVGLVGLAGAAFLFQGATPANMQALPASIILLLSLGSLLNGLIPRQSITGKVPRLDTGLLDRVHVQVTKPEPVTIQWTDFDLVRTAELFRQGWSAADVSRAVYPGYDGLGEFEKRAVQSTLENAVKRSKLR
ncbi:MAG: hypothetical protein ACK5AZ_25725 [Bryobacteraceae bacterium]